jgi:hypothetical protein
MARDKRLIELFLTEFNEWTARSYNVVDWPDLQTRDRKAVDALARDDQGRCVAIEHTLLQPFTGEKADAVAFLKVAGSLDRRTDLVEPNWMIDLVFEVGAIPKGIDWSSVAQRLEQWFVNIRPNLPGGNSQHQVSQLPFALVVTVDKSPLPDSPGALFVFRALPPQPIRCVVRIGLAAKLPKLVATQADERILLFEMDSPARGYWEVGQAIEELRGEFRELATVSSVWVARTVAWERENWVGFHLIWPLDLVERHQDWRRARPNTHPTAAALMHCGRG